MPGNVDFVNIFIVLKGGSQAGPFATIADAQAAGSVTLNYGILADTVISFILISFEVFMVVKSVNKIPSEKEAPAVEPDAKECHLCFFTIAIKATRCPSCTSEL